MREHPLRADMRELPKVAVERLKTSAASAAHPDADVLTAFAERLLAAPERALVLEHLARCAGCRDVVALALPATEVGEPVPASIGPRRWWSWPVLRGAAVVAAVIAVAAVGLYQYQHRRQANVIVARSMEHGQVVALPVPNEPARQAETGNLPSESRPEAAPAASQSRLLAGKDSSGTGWRAKSMGAVAGSSGKIGGGAGLAPGTKMAMSGPPRDLAFATPPRAPSAQMKSPVTAASPAGRDLSAVASQTVEVQSQAEAGALEARAPSPLPNIETAKLQASAESVDNVVRAKPATPIGGPPVSVAAPAAVSATLARTQLDQHQTVVPHWTISSTGSLQRSLDGGQTWQDVNVNARPGLYASSMQMAVVSKGGEAKEVARDAQKKTKPETLPVFRAVAAIDNQVWAGASGGLLYHSSDAGTLWTSLVLSAQGVTLTGDIIRIEFADTLHGRITTSTSELWTTADGGQSWQKE